MYGTNFVRKKCHRRPSGGAAGAAYPCDKKQTNKKQNKTKPEEDKYMYGRSRATEENQQHLQHVIKSLLTARPENAVNSLRNNLRWNGKFQTRSWRIKSDLSLIKQETVLLLRKGFLAEMGGKQL